jgi:hypothetical protein
MQMARRLTKEIKMAAKSRIYKVTHAPTGTVRLVEGQTISAVARYLVATDYSIAPCNCVEAVGLAASGIKPESAAAKQCSGDI